MTKEAYNYSKVKSGGRYIEDYVTVFSVVTLIKFKLIIKLFLYYFF